MIKLPRCAFLLARPVPTGRITRRAGVLTCCAAMSSSAPHPNIITDRDEALKIAINAKTVAVLGCKTESHAGQPAFFVPEYLHSVGVNVIPVPVYYPDVKEILGRPVVRDLKSIKEHVDILDVFRRPQDLAQHLDDILALKPDCVWLQSGISHPEFEQRVAEAGISVVPSRCLKVDRAAAGGRSAL